MSANLSGPRIAITGAGKVGAATAYSLIHKNVASEILILDAMEEFRDAQIEDLQDATSFGISPRVRAATWQECGQADIIVFTAGTNQKAGEDRLALLQRNLEVLKDAFMKMRPFREDAILLMVTNPVDIMTYFAVKYSGLPVNQVIGSGTILDTTRMKDAIARAANVAPRSVHGYIVGEHGESQTVAWSNMTIGGIPLPHILALSPEDKETLAVTVRTKANRLNRIKKETSWGVGAVLANICTSILLDERNILPISHYQEDHGVCFSRPAVIGRGGIYDTLPLPLDASEQDSLERSATRLREIVFATENQVPVEIAPVATLDVSVPSSSLVSSRL